MDLISPASHLPKSATLTPTFLQDVHRVSFFLCMQKRGQKKRPAWVTPTTGAPSASLPFKTYPLLSEYQVGGGGNPARRFGVEGA